MRLSQKHARSRAWSLGDAYPRPAPAPQGAIAGRPTDPGREHAHLYGAENPYPYSCSPGHAPELPDDPLLAITPLDEPHPVADLPPRHRIEAKAAVERRGLERASRLEQQAILEASPAAAPALHDDQPDRERLGRGILG